MIYSHGLMNKIKKDGRINKKTYSPLFFLASLGAGGIAVIPFAFFQYTVHKGKGLITWFQLGHGTLPLWQEIAFYAMETVMIVFAVIHIVLTISNLKMYIPWLKSQEHKVMQNDPLKNSALIAPFISFAMTMNLFIAVFRFFIPTFQTNFQEMMLPALIAWGLIWLFLMKTEIKLLTISFENSFDVEKIGFGWLLHPFALAMVTVLGMGIAAMSKTHWIADTAAFMSLVSGMMGGFLLLVKLISIFKSHFQKDGLYEKQFMPNYLIVVPILTLFAISGFRFGHYLEHAKHIDMKGFISLSIILAYAFQIWFLMFGLNLLKNYFKKDFFKKEYYLSQWGLICPFVAFAVLGVFAFKVFLSSPIFLVLTIASMITAITFYLILLSRHLKCKNNAGKINC